MTAPAPRMVVAGDVCVDCLRWPALVADEGMNWQLDDGVSWAALLLVEMLRRPRAP
jgi:hypothetical protein